MSHYINSTLYLQLHNLPAIYSKKDLSVLTIHMQLYMANITNKTCLYTLQLKSVYHFYQIAFYIL
jgi:hypothetical protein